MATPIEIIERMERVEEGDEVCWNGRTEPHPVTAVTDEHFTVRNTRGDRFRFHKDELPPSVTNLDSDNDWYVDEFEILNAKR